MSNRRTLAVWLIMALLGTGCTISIGVQSDPLPSGGFVSRLVIIPRDAQPLGDVTPFAIPTVDVLPTPMPVLCVGVVTANPRLNVRAEPGGTVIGSVARWTEVEIIGSAGDWLQIVSPPGWVSGLFVRRECATDAIP